MNVTPEDRKYYQRRTVQIRSRQEPAGTLPNDPSLRTFLGGFGTIWDLQFFRVIGGAIVGGRPNTAIVVFELPRAAMDTIQSSGHNEDGSFWRINSIIAHSLQIRMGPAMGYISKRMFSGLNGNRIQDGLPAPELVDSPLHGNRTVLAQETVSLHPSAIRPIMGREVLIVHTVPAREYVYISDSSRSATPETEIKTETPEWMRARIAQLEVELDLTRASRDAAISGQDVNQRAHQAEQNLCREAMEQRDTTLLREEAEQTRLRCKLAAMSARKSTPSKGNDVLWKQLADVKETLEQKIQPNGTSLDDVKASIKTLESRLNRLESRVALTGERF
ncbi:unnamed protein product [Rhizoctonia solani]|uniref:Uncharacterized protein n=1 Tax=Rhizoctonia solani TaxID=456999 RepID=A0A8H3E1L6_9AGAM|nr:unnamed protein product [Rhizoctonia solani]